MITKNYKYNKNFHMLIKQNFPVLIQIKEVIVIKKIKLI
jgi:hypothetical protein